MARIMGFADDERADSSMRVSSGHRFRKMPTIGMRDTNSVFGDSSTKVSMVFLSEGRAAPFLTKFRARFRASFSARVRINSPNRVLAQANHGRVNFSGLSFRNASWINCVPAVVSRNHRKHWTISRSSLDVSACTMIDMGQTYDKPTCGLQHP